MSFRHSISKSSRQSSVSVNSWREQWASCTGRQGKPVEMTRMFASKLSASLVPILLAALMTTSCGGSSSSSTPPTTTGTGALYTTLSDTPSCDVLGFGLFLTELDLHRQGTSATSKVTVFPTNISTTSPVVEVSNLRDTSTIANLTTINAGTYDQAILTVTVDSAAIYDPTATPPASNFTTTVTTTNVTVNIQPPLTVTDGKTSMLKLDFNLPQSLAVDSQGQLTGSVTPVFSARPIEPSGASGFGEIGYLEGFVRTVSSSSPGTGFTSSFLLQTLAGRGPALTVDLTDSTQLLGVSRIDQMPTGSFVEVDAYVDSNGNLVAKTVQIEAREDVTTQTLAYLGPVLTVTRDSSGNVTQFDMLAHFTEPGDTTDISSNSVLTVSVSPSTTFAPYLLSTDLTNLAQSGNLVFNAQTLAPGQEVVVHGVFTKPSSGLVSVAADQIYPELQSFQGDFSSLIQVGSDDKTGAFNFTPCSDLLKSTPFIVVTDAQTQFINAVGLSSLSPTTPILARGLPFLDVQGGTVNGVPIPAGTMVLLANHVRQF